MKKIILIGLILAAGLFVISFINFIELSSFFAAPLNALIGIGTLYAVDKYGIDEIDTIEELKKGNIAYGLALIAYAVIVAAGISAG